MKEIKTEDLPEKIKVEEEKILVLCQRIESCHKEIKRQEAQVTLEVYQMKDRSNKPMYTNDTQRKAKIQIELETSCSLVFNEAEELKEERDKSIIERDYFKRLLQVHLALLNQNN